MAYLKFYRKETEMFPEAFNIKVSDHEAELIVRKLLRHFGRKGRYSKVKIRFWGHRGSGGNGWFGIRLSHDPSIGLICHEVAHDFHSKHDKILLRYIKRMIAYCEKNSYWIYVLPTIDSAVGFP